MDVSPGHVPSCWELCPFPGRSPSHAGLCLISDTDSRQRNRDPGSLPRLGAPLQGHPFPQLPGGSARLASQFSSSLCPVPTSLIHSVCAQLLRCIQLIVTLWTVAHQAPLPMGFSRQEYWSGLPCPPPGDLLNPGIKPTSLTSPALTGGFFTTSATWEALFQSWGQIYYFPELR